MPSFFDMLSNPQTPQDQAKANAVHALLAGLGVGAAARGTVGLWNLAKRQLKPPRAKYPAALLTRVPYPEEPAEKTAGGDPNGYWWAIPAMTGGATAGLIGGWKGLDAILNQRRKSEQSDDLEAAKSDFEQALMGSYTHPVTTGQKLGAALDQLYDTLQTKQADWSDTVGKTMGGYLGVYAMPTAGITAYLAYKATSKANQRAILEKAMKARLRRAAQARPSEIYAIGQGVPAGQTPQLPALPEEEEAE